MVSLKGLMAVLLVIVNLQLCQNHAHVLVINYYFPLREMCLCSEFLWSEVSRICTEYGEILHISQCGKIRTRKTPNTDFFHPVSTTTSNLG